MWTLNSARQTKETASGHGVFRRFEVRMLADEKTDVVVEYVNKLHARACGGIFRLTPPGAVVACPLAVRGICITGRWVALVGPVIATGFKWMAGVLRSLQHSCSGGSQVQL